jgi:hypothetical protein
MCVEACIEFFGVVKVVVCKDRLEIVMDWVGSCCY